MGTPFPGASVATTGHSWTPASGPSSWGPSCSPGRRHKVNRHWPAFVYPGAWPGVNPPEESFVNRVTRHGATGLYAHITWHTKYRERSVRRADTGVITDAVLAAGQRTRVRVIAQAVLADH